MCTRFICSMQNEAFLKAVFKEKGGELTFAKAIQIANEIEEATKVAKETIGSNVDDTHAVRTQAHIPPRRSTFNKVAKPNDKSNNNGQPCGRCGKTGHTGSNCRYKTYVCNYCKKIGHIERACHKKPKDTAQVQTIKLVKSTPQLKQTLCIDGEEVVFEVDTGAGDSFLSKISWLRLGKPALQVSNKTYESASEHHLPVLGVFKPNSVSIAQDHNSQIAVYDVNFVVTELPQLNLLGSNVIVQLGVSVDYLLYPGKASSSVTMEAKPVYQCIENDTSLQSACKQLCDQFPHVFKCELGCFKDYELDVKFKPDAEPIFCKPRPVPFALRDDLSRAFDKGIAQGCGNPCNSMIMAHLLFP